MTVEGRTIYVAVVAEIKPAGTVKIIGVYPPIGPTELRWLAAELRTLGSAVPTLTAGGEL